jgi:hypothetical protein
MGVFPRACATACMNACVCMYVCIDTHGRRMALGLPPVPKQQPSDNKHKIAPAVSEKLQREEAEKKLQREQQRKMAIRRKMGINSTEQLQTVLLRAAEEGNEGEQVCASTWKCMYVCVCVYNAETKVNQYTRLHGNVCLSPCVYVYVCVYIYIYAETKLNQYYTFMCKCMSVCVCVCVYVYTYASSRLSPNSVAGTCGGDLHSSRNFQFRRVQRSRSCG